MNICYISPIGSPFSTMKNGKLYGRYFRRNETGQTVMNQPYCLPISMGFFRLQTSYSNLPKQVGILNPSIQIVFQNIENSCIPEHVKIGPKTANFSQIS